MTKAILPPERIDEIRKAVARSYSPNCGRTLEEVQSWNIAIAEDDAKQATEAERQAARPTAVERLVRQYAQPIEQQLAAVRGEVSKLRAWKKGFVEQSMPKLAKLLVGDVVMMLNALESSILKKLGKDLDETTERVRRMAKDIDALEQKFAPLQALDKNFEHLIARTRDNEEMAEDEKALIRKTTDDWIDDELRRCFEALHERIAKIEAQPSVRDAGVWQARAYLAGDGVTHKGSFWIAQRPTSGVPGEENSGWRLAVKRGRDGRDGAAGYDPTRIPPTHEGP